MFNSETRTGMASLGVMVLLAAGVLWNYQPCLYPEVPVVTGRTASPAPVAQVVHVTDIAPVPHRRHH